MAQTIISLAALLSVATAGQPAGEPPALTGSVTYYNPGIMEATYRARLQWGHVAPCPDCVGMIALLDPAHLGKRVWLQRPGHPIEGPFLVVDCAAEKDRARLRARGLVGEVGWPVAQRWRMTAPIHGVTVWFTNPTRAEAPAHEQDEIPPATGLLHQSRRQRPS